MTPPDETAPNPTEVVGQQDAASAAAPNTTVGAPEVPERKGEEARTGGHTITVADLDAYYGEVHAIKGVSIDYAANDVTAMIGPSGCGKSTVLRCLNRMHEEITGAYATGTVKLDDTDIYGSEHRRRRRAALDRHGVPEAEPVPDHVGGRQRRRRPEARGRQGQAQGRGGREVAARRRPVGGGQGPPERARRRPIRRPAAAPVHRAHDRDPARHHPHGRALLGPGPDRHAEDRGAHPRAQARRTRSSS